MTAHDIELVVGTVMYNRKKTDEESSEFKKSRRERREIINQILKHQ